MSHTPSFKIELDLPAEAPEPRPVTPPPPMPSRPPVIPATREEDIGSDTAEQTVGWIYLLSALPGVVGLLTGQGFLGLAMVGMSLYLGIGLIRGDDFATEYARIISLIRLVMALVLVLIPPHALLGTAIDVGQSAALLVLLSGRALSRTAYGVCVGTVVLGTLLGFMRLL